MSRVRRTSEEIAAGFPHELKIEGVLFEDWSAKKDKVRTVIKEDTATQVGVKRTQEEIEAGFPLEEKRNGVLLAEWLDRTKKAVNAGRKAAVLDPPPEVKQPPVPKKREIEYVKHTETIIVKTDENAEELRGLIQEAYDSCVWEWKEVPIDSKFKVSRMKTLGSQGWRYAYIFDPKCVDSNSKKPQIMMFQRPRRKKK